jgi:predicted NUDIX family NTP pyrophosphohydrolase
MPSVSAGLLLFRRRDGALEVLLAHMGGPFWSKKDAGAWSLPKGEYDDGENPLEAARREFAEELGFPPPAGEPVELGCVRQRGGKVVHAWALEGDADARAVRSNVFELEWPRGSGALKTFPEVDRAAWFDLETAREKLLPSQLEFLERLRQRVS